MPHSLFRHDQQHPRAGAAAHAVSAYKDNAAVVEGFRRPALPLRCATPANTAPRPLPTARSASRSKPTTIRPRSRRFPGASTGAGGEIRDEGATGRGGRPKAGLTGFSASRTCASRPCRSRGSSRAQLNPRMASALEIMLDGPLGGGRVQQRVRPAQPDRLFPQLRACRPRSAGRRPRLRQADHARRRPRRDRPPTGREAAAAARRCGHRARRPGDADRPGRRRGQSRSPPGDSREDAGFRLGAARQPGDGAALPGSDRPLRRAGRRQSDPLQCTTSAPAACPMPSRNCCTIPASAA